MRASVWTASLRMRARRGAAASAEVEATEKVSQRRRTRLDTPSRIFALRILLYSRASAAVSPSSRKNERAPISSAGSGELAMVSCAELSAPK